MPQATVQFLIQKAITASITASNHGFYERRQLDNIENFRKVPHCIYYYHIKLGDDGEPDVNWYFRDNGNNEIPYNRIEDYVTPLAQNAHTGGRSPAPYGSGTHNMEWSRISYLVFLMDSKYWKFSRYDNGKVAMACDSRSPTQNHTFFDARDLNIDISPNRNGDFRSAVAFINHIKKTDDGGQLGGVSGPKETEDYKLSMYFEVIDRTGGVSAIEWDPDGTNEGPPVGPP